MSDAGAAILTIWGAGGSAPAASGARARYGGETVCFGLMHEDKLMEHSSLLVDLGSGARDAGRAIAAGARAAQTPPRVEVLLSHMHLDHVAGAPFFEPFYCKDARVNLHCGLFETAQAFGDKMRGAVAPPWFPVEPLSFGAAHFHVFKPDAPFMAAEMKVTAAAMHHPGGCMGFRIEGADWALAVIGDHEHGCPVADAAVRRLADGATVMIYDAAYDANSYPAHEGWGHSTWQKGVELAQEAGVAMTFLHHHLPDRTDDALDIIDARVRAADPTVCLARQGMRLRLSANGPEVLG